MRSHVGNSGVKRVLFTVLLAFLALSASCASATPEFLRGKPGEIDKVFRPMLADIYGEQLEPTGSLVADPGIGSGIQSVFVDYRIAVPVDMNHDIKSEFVSRLEMTGAIVTADTGTSSQFTLEYSGLRVGNDSGTGTVRVSRTSVAVRFDPESE